MKTIKFFAYTNTGESREITGEKLPVKGFEEYDFVLHKSLMENDGWVVSEASSGFCILSGTGGFIKYTRSGAIKEANTTMAKVDKKLMQTKIAEAKIRLKKITDAIANDPITCAIFNAGLTLTPSEIDDFKYGLELAGCKLVKIGNE